MWSYVNGFLASLGGCTLPVLSVIVAKMNEKNFNRWIFLLQFAVTQFLIFLLINLAAASFYSLFENLQSLVLLVAALVTFALGISLWMGKPLNVPALGGIYGIALSPCSVGFVVATAATSVDYASAIINSLLFTLGLMTPIVVVALVLRDTKILLKYSSLVEKVGAILLVIVSYYLAYLAGSSWRWVP